MTTAKPVKRPRGEGQWKLGYREPLNPNEQFKKDDDALNVRARIVDIYSKQGFDSIDKQDLRGRMRWMGLYTQREQGYDGTWTGDENAELLGLQHGGLAAGDALRPLGVEAHPPHPAAQIVLVDAVEALLGVDVDDARAHIERVVVLLELFVGVQRLALAEGPLALTARFGRGLGRLAHEMCSSVFKELAFESR